MRRIFDQNGRIPAEVLADPNYFAAFALRLPKRADGAANPFNGLTYETLGERKTEFDIKTIRNVIIKQLVPQEGMSSVYEIFSRLNSGGENLERQELRSSLYHSAFYNMLGRANELPSWRRLFGEPEPNLHMRDIQHLLRAFALLCREYAPSMVRFLDRFSIDAKKFDTARVTYLEALFASFIAACSQFPDTGLQGQGRAFSVMLFEAVFHAACFAPHAQQQLVQGKLDFASVEALRRDAEFEAASSRGTTSKANVAARISAASRLVRFA